MWTICNRPHILYGVTALDQCTLSLSQYIFLWLQVVLLPLLFVQLCKNVVNPRLALGRPPRLLLVYGLVFIARVDCFMLALNALGLILPVLRLIIGKRAPDQANFLHDVLRHRFVSGLVQPPNIVILEQYKTIQWPRNMIRPLAAFAHMLALRLDLSKSGVRGG